MKKLPLYLLLVPILLISCEKRPDAYFSATPGDPVVGETVFFSNNSSNAESFEWDFGDGYISEDVNPTHEYMASGSYEVILTAYSRNGNSSTASLTIEVKIPTLLEIEVLEYYQEYPVEGASVRLYPTLNDWDNETNLVYEGYTDSDGRVVFADLVEQVYYVDVWESYHDNYALRNEDVGFIRTPEILRNRINRFTAYVDYVDHGKSAGRRTPPYIVKSPGRRATDKEQAGPYPDNENWQELFNKSIRK
jgi:PKD repeat protein